MASSSSATPAAKAKTARLDSEPHYTQVLSVKNTFFEFAPSVQERGRAASKASSDPTSNASSRSSSSADGEEATPTVAELRAGWRHPSHLEQSLGTASSSGDAATQRAPEADREKARKKKDKGRKKEARRQEQGLAKQQKEHATAARMLARAMKDKDHWSLQLPSIGTIHHSMGTCTPCESFTRCEPCPKGVDCEECHARDHMRVKL